MTIDPTSSKAAFPKAQWPILKAAVRNPQVTQIHADEEAGWGDGSPLSSVTLQMKSCPAPRPSASAKSAKICGSAALFRLIASTDLKRTRPVDPAREPKSGPASSISVDFNRNIRPLLERSCTGCHSGEKPRGGYGIPTRDLALKGVQGGEPAIVPGNGDASALLRFVQGQRVYRPQLELSRWHEPTVWTLQLIDQIPYPGVATQGAAAP